VPTETVAPLRFGHRSVDFLICRNCGVYVATIMGSGEGRYAVINVRALEWPPRSCRYRRLFSFDGEQAAERNARRLKRWTPVVGHGDLA
jgi:hypothetical protein